MPLSLGSVHVSVALEADARAAVRPLGAAGAGVAADEVADAPSPEAFTARVWNVYAAPLARPVTVSERVEWLLDATSVHEP